MRGCCCWKGCGERRPWLSRVVLVSDDVKFRAQGLFFVMGWSVRGCACRFSRLRKIYHFLKLKASRRNAGTEHKQHARDTQHTPNTWRAAHPNFGGNIDNPSLHRETQTFGKPCSVRRDMIPQKQPPPHEIRVHSWKVV